MNENGPGRNPGPHPVTGRGEKEVVTERRSESNQVPTVRAIIVKVVWAAVSVLLVVWQVIDPFEPGWLSTGVMFMWAGLAGLEIGLIVDAIRKRRVYEARLTRIERSANSEHGSPDW